MWMCFEYCRRKIRQAIRNGDLDHIPGKGKPLQLEDLSMVPPELRMSYKILKTRA